jgi:hypothetical protein
MLGPILPIRSVRQPFADLGQMVLTLGLVEGGEKFGARAHEMTAPAP